MLFYTFEKLKDLNTSAFIELQFCTLPHKSSVKKLVSVNSIHNRKTDSLFVTDTETFYSQYSNIFDCGIYNNLQNGVVDICGINYYPPSVLDVIITRINDHKPEDYHLLIQWLNNAKNYNGFYILGI